MRQGTPVERVAMNLAIPKAVPKWRQMSRRDRRRLIEGLLFVSPWLFGFLTLTVYPLIFSFYISLTRYDLIRAPEFAGLANYTELLFEDPLFWTVMYNTLFYVLLSVPLSLIFAFSVAN